MWQMIKSTPGPDKMKVSHHDWTFRLFVRAVLFLTLSAQTEGNCEPGIRVRRNTSHNVSVGDPLKISCPVSFCDNSPPSVTWFKLEADGYEPVNMSDRAKTEWEIKGHSEGISYFIIENVQESDRGEYQCRTGNNVGHNIMIHVTGVIADVNTTLQDQTSENNTFTDGSNQQQLWLYLYTAVGIVGFVVIVIVISAISMRGCNGGRKNKTQSENQYMDVPMIEQRVHHSSNQALPRPSPCGTPSHRTSRKAKSPSAPPQRHVYGQMEDQRNGSVDQGSSVVYAALNHQHLAGASPRARTAVDESSEYSAIRVS